jgi:hypothetical protein
MGGAELSDNVTAVTQEQVQRLARSVFGAPRHVWSEIGPGAKGERAKVADRVVRRLVLS